MGWDPVLEWEGSVMMGFRYLRGVREELLGFLGLLMPVVRVSGD